MKLLPLTLCRQFPHTARSVGWFSSNYTETTAAEVFPAHRRAAGSPTGRPLRVPPRPAVRSGSSPRPAVPTAGRPSRGAAGRPGRGGRLPPGSAGYTTAAAGGEPGRIAGSGLRNCCSPDPVSLGTEEPLPLCGAPPPRTGDPARAAAAHRGERQQAGAQPRPRGIALAGRDARERPPASPGRWEAAAPTPTAPGAAAGGERVSRGARGPASGSRYLG